MIRAMAAEGVPLFGGYTFPLYANPLFQNIDFNSPRSIYQFRREAPVPDFRGYKERCPVTERACGRESLWITSDLLLGTEEDTRDIVRAFEKLYEHRCQLL